jgi:hypothetical protein
MDFPRADDGVLGTLDQPASPELSPGPLELGEGTLDNC